LNKRKDYLETELVRLTRGSTSRKRLRSGFSERTELEKGKKIPGIDPSKRSPASATKKKSRNAPLNTEVRKNHHTNEMGRKDDLRLRII